MSQNRVFGNAAVDTNNHVATGVLLRKTLHSIDRESSGKRMTDFADCISKTVCTCTVQVPVAAVTFKRILSLLV